MKHLYYVEHAPYLTKIGMYEKGIYTEEEVANLKACGHYIFRKKKLVAKCKGQEVEVRRKSHLAHTTFGKYGMGVECIE